MNPENTSFPSWDSEPQGPAMNKFLPWDQWAIAWNSILGFVDFQ
jgi:hypothetical protein